MAKISDFLPVGVVLFALAAAVPGGARAADVAAVSSTRLHCSAWFTQTCHFVVSDGSGGVERYRLAAGASRELPQGFVGRRYRLSVNFEPPGDLGACSRSPTPEMKRSHWCRAGVLQVGVNE